MLKQAVKLIIILMTWRGYLLFFIKQVFVSISESLQSNTFEFRGFTALFPTVHNKAITHNKNQ